MDKKRGRKLAGRLVLAVVLVLACVAVGRRYENRIRGLLHRAHPSLRSSGQRPAEVRRSADLVESLRTALLSLEVDSAGISSQLFLEDNTRELKTAVPRGRPAELVVWLLTDAASRSPYTVRDCSWDPRSGRYEILYESRRQGRENVRLVFTWAERYYSRTAAVAFLIQEFGFEANATTVEFLSFPDPLTVSLTAGEDKSSWTARIADHYRKEVVILLPLESKTVVSRPSAPPTIMVHHTEEQIVKAVADAMRCIPNYTGFCGLDGSRVLEDSRATKILLREIKRANGYFVDTKATPVSLVPQTAAAIGLPYRQVDGVIEEGGAQRVDEQIAAVMRRAQKTGQALVTAPPTAAVIAALNRNRSMLARNGVRLVYVSEVLNHPDG